MIVVYMCSAEAFYDHLDDTVTGDDVRKWAYENARMPSRPEHPDAENLPKDWSDTVTKTLLDPPVVEAAAQAMAGRILITPWNELSEQTQAAFITDAGIVLIEVARAMNAVGETKKQPHPRPNIADVIQKDQRSMGVRFKRYQQTLQNIYNHHQLREERCLDGGGAINPTCTVCKVKYPCKTVEAIADLSRH